MEGYIEYIRVNLVDGTEQHFNSFEEAGMANPFDRMGIVKQRKKRKEVLQKRTNK